MRSFLVHADQDVAFEQRLTTALQLAARVQGHVRLCIATPLQQFVSFDPFGGTYFAADALAKAQIEDAQLEQTLAERMAQESISWDIYRANGDVVGSLGGAAAFADLAIVSLADDDAPQQYGPSTLAGDLALGAHIPVLALTRGAASLATEGPVVLAWNGSLPAAKALRGVIPLMTPSDPLILLTVGDVEYDYSAEDALAYAKQHGIHARHHRVEPDGHSVEDVIETEALAAGARLIAMGAYGRSRLRETLFGGTTQRFLKTSPLPLLLAH